MRGFGGRRARLRRGRRLDGGGEGRLEVLDLGHRPHVDPVGLGEGDGGFVRLVRARARARCPGRRGPRRREFALEVLDLRLGLGAEVPGLGELGVSVREGGLDGSELVRIFRGCRVDAGEGLAESLLSQLLALFPRLVERYHHVLKLLHQPAHLILLLGSLLARLVVLLLRLGLAKTKPLDLASQLGLAPSRGVRGGHLARSTPVDESTTSRARLERAADRARCPPRVYQ